MLLFLDVVFAEGIIVGRGQAVLDIVEPTAARVQDGDLVFTLFYQKRLTLTAASELFNTIKDAL